MIVEPCATVDPETGSADFVRSQTPGIAVLVTVQVTTSPSASVTTPASTAAPVQLQSLAV